LSPGRPEYEARVLTTVAEHGQEAEDVDYHYLQYYDNNNDDAVLRTIRKITITWMRLSKCTVLSGMAGIAITQVGGDCLVVSVEP
jgi:hypothetical protein